MAGNEMHKLRDTTNGILSIDQWQTRVECDSERVTT